MARQVAAPRLTSRSIWLGVALCAMAACDEPERAASTASPPQLTSEAFAAARQPGRTFYFAKTSEHCELYWLEGDQLGPPKRVACVAYIDVGERIRVVGNTCERESKDASRSIPVLCPPDLSAFEKDWYDQLPAPSAAPSATK